MAEEGTGAFREHLHSSEFKRRAVVVGAIADVLQNRLNDTQVFVQGRDLVETSLFLFRTYVKSPLRSDGHLPMKSFVNHVT